MTRLFLIFFVISGLLMTGCSREPEEMSSVRTELILDIFKLIKQNRHEEAYVKVKKLRELDPTNALLPILEDIEKNNGELQRVNTLLQSRKKQSEATAFLKALIDQQTYIADKGTSRTVEKLKDLLRLDELSDIMIDPKPVFMKNKKFHPASVVLDNAIEEFILITQKWHLRSSLRTKAIRMKQFAAKLRKEEQMRAVQSLELFAPGLSEDEYQTMMALSKYAGSAGTK